MSAGKRRPNLIYILCDDLGYGDVGCYGSQVNDTPCIDKLAGEGRLFTDFCVSQPLCSPSRASLMTGCYAKRVGLDGGHRFCVLLPVDPIGISSNEITMPEILKHQGYSTQIIGKWHLGDQPPFLPTRHGFDHFFGLPYSNDMQVGVMDWYPPLPLMEDERVIGSEPDQEMLTDRYTDRAIDFIKHHRDKPFFLYLAHMYVHVPLHFPRAYLEKSRNGEYGATVAHLDYATGALLDALDETGMAENTLVVFTSDNGAHGWIGSSNAPLRGRKGSTWEGGVREPFIARWPGTIPEGTRCGEFATNMDILPTFAQLAGGEAPRDRIIDGKDIRPLLLGDPEARSPHEAFFYYNAHKMGSGETRLEAIRSGRWKLHLTDEAEHMLVDLETDIGETLDVSAERPDIVRRLQALAESAREDLGDVERPGRNCRPAGRVEEPVPLLMAR